MKKLFLLSLVFLTVFSCGDEVEFNSPAFQGSYNNSQWRAKSFFASINDAGNLNIRGINSAETVELILPSAVVGDYVIGDVNLIEARFTAADGTIYSTNNPNNSSLYSNDGEINLTEILNNTFTGTFRFNATDETGLKVVNFTGGTTEEFNGVTNPPIYGGVFYKVPLLYGSIPANPVTCVDFEVTTDAAQVAYEATFASSIGFISKEDYAEACSNYIDALISQIDFCGDSSGETQAIIDDLGDCQISCEDATDNVDQANAQYSNATIGNFSEKCAQYIFYLQEQIEICGDEDGSIQAKIDDVDCGDSDGDGVPNVFENFNGDPDGNLDDLGDDSDGDGIFNYLDDDDDGDGILTQYEAVDADGNPVDTDGNDDVDYLDNDDDGDGILTIDENADPNGDGNPDDAVDTDGDGVPDYLQA